MATTTEQIFRNAFASLERLKGIVDHYASRDVFYVADYVRFVAQVKETREKVLILISISNTPTRNVAKKITQELGKPVDMMLELTEAGVISRNIQLSYQAALTGARYEFLNDAANDLILQEIPLSGADFAEVKTHLIAYSEKLAGILPEDV